MADRDSNIFIDDSRAKFYASKEKFGPDGFVLQHRFSAIANQVENFEVRDNDTFVMGFQKTGTTWVQEMVWCIENDLNFAKSKDIVLNYKFPLLEMCVYPRLSSSADTPWLDSLNFLHNLTEKRFIKTHLPWPLVPKQIRSGEKKPKIVYVYRDPKDTCISLYYHLRKIGFYQGTINELLEEMLNDTELYCPFWKHVEGFLERENLPNLYITTYEEMKKDLPGVIRQVAKFLEKPLTDEQVDLLHNHLTFNTMLENKSINNRKFEGKSFEFLRKGEIGDHKNYLSAELEQRFDDWTRISRERYGHA